ncbi:MAG: DUF2442 domain-containing protein [Pseudomonadota bacterium]
MSGETVAQENPAAGITPAPVPAAPWRIKAFTVLPGYRLALTFMDGTDGVADCSAILTASAPGIYAPLREPEYFGQVRLELGVPTWPNGADLDPAWLFDNLSGGKTWSVPF